MRFRDLVEVVIYDDEGSFNDHVFTLAQQGLDMWPGKPWSLHPGSFACGAMTKFNNHGVCGGRFADDIGFLRRTYNTAELYAILEHAVCHGHVDGGDLCEGTLLHDNRRGDVLCGDLLPDGAFQIRTWGLCNRSLGEKLVHVRTRKGEAGSVIDMQHIIESVREVWPEGPDDWLRMHPIPSCFAGKGDGDAQEIRLIVEFEGWPTAMANVPILFTCHYTIGADKYTEDHAAYVDHVMTYETFVMHNELDEVLQPAFDNSCCIWINGELVIPGMFYLVLPGDNVYIAIVLDDYVAGGLAMDGDNDTAAGSRPTRKRARSEDREQGERADPNAGGSLDDQDEGPPDDDGNEGESDPISDDEGEDDDYNTRVRAHLFHHCNDHIFERMDAADPVSQRQQVAQAWGIPVNDVMGIHPVRSPPQDLVGSRVFITRHASDADHREWPDDVQVLLDIYIQDPRGPEMKRRSVRWSRPATTRLGILRWTRVEGYCRREAQQGCQVWYNNVEWAVTDLRIQRLGMGDYIKLILPTQAGRNVLESDRRLRQLERICRFEYFFDSPSSDDGDSTDEVDPAEESESGCSRHTLPEPEPHDGPATPVCLVEGLSDSYCYQPFRAPPQKTEAHGQISFAEVWDLLVWLDSATIMPGWLLHGDREWHDSTLPWLDGDWWSFQKPLEFWLYTDGSCTPQGAGAGVVLFVRSEEGWHYGGFLAQPCLRRCAHYAELQALVMSFHWLHCLLTYCALAGLHPPVVHFCFDATSAGYKAFGFWGGNQYCDETANIRSTWQFLTSKFNFEWYPWHVAAHTGDPGNEAANSVAQMAAAATIPLRCTSTWGYYVMPTRESAIHWLWSLWKEDWKDFWRGTSLMLPTCPATKPSAGVLGLCEPPAEFVCAGCESTELTCVLATANVLTLLPGRKQLQESGLQGRTRTAALQRQFGEQGVHVIGLQETRMKKPARFEADEYYVLCGSATARGHYGTQIWFSKHLPLDREGTMFFRKEHLKIVYQDPRCLFVRVLAPFLQAIFISAHAPHTMADAEAKSKWWEDLEAYLPKRYRCWHRFVMIDANARVGEYPSGLVGDHDADQQDDNGALFTEYLARGGIWLPSTFSTLHDGDSGTWWHQQSGKWIRGDFIGLSTSLPLTSCSSRILDSIDLALQKDDHKPASVTATWQVAISPQSKIATWSNYKFDSQVIQEALTGPDSTAYLATLDQCLPKCDWTVDVHTHMAFIQQGLQGWAHSLCRNRRKKPLKKTLSEETWRLVCEKRDLRQQQFTNKRIYRLDCLRCLFSRWKGVPYPWPQETKEQSHQRALDLHRFTQLGKEVTRAVRYDDKKFFEDLCSSMGDPLDKSVSAETWKSIRWAMPKIQSKRRQSPLLLEELDHQWLPHFAELEAGQITDTQKLIDDCWHRQQQRVHLRDVRLSDIPTLGEVEATLRAVRPHRAPGPDRLPGSLFRFGAVALAKEIHGVLAKSITWEVEAVQCKGGIMMPIHKAGTTTLACQYRGIMMLNVLAKSLHVLMRKRIMELLTPIRLSSQLGGFSFQQAQFRAQCVQTLARICAAKGLSHCTLFVDVKGAYHYLIRELVLGVEKKEDLEAVLEHLNSQNIDNRGAKLWSQLPGVLERVHADPKLISILRELHCDTWAAMPHVPGLMRSRRGSRPGSPIADAIYHALMMDIHVEIHRIIEEDDEALAGFNSAEIPVCAVTWADDLAVPLITSAAESLVPLVQRITRRVLLAFERRGLVLNLSKNKTAAVLSFKGDKASTMRKEFLLKPMPGCLIQVTETRSEWLHFTGHYKHLGAIFCADGDMKKEVLARIGTASQTYSAMQRTIFKNRHLGIRVRLQLFDSLVLSQLFYGMSTWSSLGAGLLEKVEGFVIRCQRAICNFDRMKTNDEFRGLYQLPRIDVRLATTRLLYVSKAWTHGPDLLRQLLCIEDSTCSHSWIGALRLDLAWCTSLVNVGGLFDEHPGEDLSPEILAPLWRQRPRKWTSLIKKAFHRGKLQEAIAHEVRGWHHTIVADLQEAGGQFHGVPGKPPDGTHRCHCGKLCKSAQGLSVHKMQVHGERPLKASIWKARSARFA